MEHTPSQKNVDTLTFELDLSKVRDIYLKKMRTDLWGGAEAFMFSCTSPMAQKTVEAVYLRDISCC